MASDSDKVHLFGQPFRNSLNSGFTIVNNHPSSNQYFEHMFQDNCEFKVSQCEVERIQTIIETTVIKLLSSVVESDSYSACLSNADVSCVLHAENLNTYNETNLLKVGSLYEGTKNAYPDEFDFIYILAEFDISNLQEANILLSKLSDEFHSCLESLCVNSKEIKYLGIHGPASKYQIEIGNSQMKCVHVDISLACRVRLNDCVPPFLKIRSNEWKKAIKEKDSFLLMKIFKNSHPKHKTRIEVTVTESENYYIRTIMSENHRRVYRLLKYLINGTDTNEALRQIVRHRLNNESMKIFEPKGIEPFIIFDFTSFVLKNFVFLHDEKCTEKYHITQCIIQVIGSILEVFIDEIDRVDQFEEPFCCKNRRFSVCIESVAGNTLEIADEYETAIEITQTFADVYENLRFHGEILTVEIPINKTFTSLAGKAIKKQRQKCVTSLCKYLVLIGSVFYFLVIMSFVQNAVCVPKSNNQPNNSRANNSHPKSDDLLCSLGNMMNQTNRNSLCMKFFCQASDPKASPVSVQFYDFGQDLFCHGVYDNSSGYIDLNDTSTSPCNNVRCTANITSLIMEVASGIKVVELCCADIGNPTEEKPPFCKAFTGIKAAFATIFLLLFFMFCLVIPWRFVLYIKTKEKLQVPDLSEWKV